LLEVEAETAELFGVFDGVLLLRHGDAPAARLQLLPELGPPILDVAGSSEHVVGKLHGAASSLAVDVRDGVPRHLFTFLVASLLEDAAPVTPERVRGVRSGADGTPASVTLRPAFCAAHDARRFGEVTLRLGPQGKPVAREHTLRSVSWTVEIADGTRRVAAPGVFLAARVLQREDVAPRPEAFELEPHGAAASAPKD
jgi:hypothetical protein